MAAVGAVEQGEEDWRFTHDGTHGVLINQFIKPRDKSRFPLGEDVKRVMEEISQEAEDSPVTSIVFDISKAHRRVMIDEEDWGLQACSVESDPPSRPEDEIYLNTVGTYGIASAAYWWSRLGVMGVRNIFYLFRSAPPALRPPVRRRREDHCVGTQPASDSSAGCPHLDRVWVSAEMVQNRRRDTVRVDRVHGRLGKVQDRSLREASIVAHRLGQECGHERISLTPRDV